MNFKRNQKIIDHTFDCRMIGMLFTANNSNVWEKNVDPDVDAERKEKNDSLWKTWMNQGDHYCLPLWGSSFWGCHSNQTDHKERQTESSDKHRQTGQHFKKESKQKEPRMIKVLQKGDLDRNSVAKERERETQTVIIIIILSHSLFTPGLWLSVEWGLNWQYVFSLPVFSKTAARKRMKVGVNHRVVSHSLLHHSSDKAFLFLYMSHEKRERERKGKTNHLTKRLWKLLL